MSIEAWAQRVGAVSVDVFAQNDDAVTLRKDAREDNHAPGHATEERDAGDGPTGDIGFGSHVKANGGLEGNKGAREAHTAGDHGVHEVDAPDMEDSESDPDDDKFADAMDRELGTTQEHDAEGETNSTGGHGKLGGDPHGRTGADTTIGGTGPGGERAKADGNGEGSVSVREPDGSASGDSFGVKSGSKNGRYGGEGRDGDDGVRGAGAVFGGVIAIPAALKGLIELGLLIDAGDITGAAGDLFKKGVGKALTVASARRMLAHEARVFAGTETKTILKNFAGNKGFLALPKAERQQLIRIWTWETQRRYFRAYLKAARAEQRATSNALKKAKPGGKTALEARRVAADTGEEIAKAEPVAGRLPRNHEYAGGEFPRSQLPPKYRKQGLKFKDTGYPDFEPYAQKLPNGQKKVYIEYTGSRTGDIAVANKVAGFEKKPQNFTWHHDEADLGAMYLVPDDLHAAVGHSGGTAEYKHRTGIVKYND